MEIGNNFEETELRLGLPGGKKDHNHTINNNIVNANGKRGFSQTHVDLKLNLSSKEASMVPTMAKNEEKDLSCISDDQVKPPVAKTQVVGWPPVRNFRKNILAVQKSDGAHEANKAAAGGGGLVKVSMDGAPYLRKVDLKMYKCYQELSDALSKMFGLFTTGNSCEANGMINFMKEKKLMDLLNNSHYVPTFEDKDCDWMLVGDVPWEMFVESCKRLRIMRGTEAAGLAPRAMERCKNRS